MIEIRACAGFEELEACVRLQIETWGYDEGDVIPRKAFLVAQKIGGQVIGAFDTEIAALPRGRSESLVGFVFSLPGVKTGKASRGLICTRTCWRCREAYRNRGSGHATQAGTTALRRCRAASGRWSGPSIRWRSRTLI